MANDKGTVTDYPFIAHLSILLIAADRGERHPKNYKSATKTVITFSLFRELVLANQRKMGGSSAIILSVVVVLSIFGCSQGALIKNPPTISRNNDLLNGIFYGKQEG